MHPAISSSMHSGGWMVVALAYEGIHVSFLDMLSLSISNLCCLSSDEWRWYYYDRDETESLEIMESENVHHQFSIYNAYLRKH